MSLPYYWIIKSWISFLYSALLSITIAFALWAPRIWSWAFPFFRWHTLPSEHWKIGFLKCAVIMCKRGPERAEKLTMSCPTTYSFSVSLRSNPDSTSCKLPDGSISFYWSKVGRRSSWWTFLCESRFPPDWAVRLEVENWQSVKELFVCLYLFLSLYLCLPRGLRNISCTNILRPPVPSLPWYMRWHLSGPVIRRSRRAQTSVVASLSRLSGSLHGHLCSQLSDPQLRRIGALFRWFHSVVLRPVTWNTIGKTRKSTDTKI